MKAAYNEHDSYAAQWLRNLVQRQLIAPGDVLECSIVDLTPNDLRKYAQVHLFAGIGIWSASLRDVGVRDDEPFWTASCPCQPFSAAGKGNGFADERHLWPATFHLVEQCRPVRIAGEQVASKDGLAWLDLVQSDMEGAGYAFGAVDTCAAGFGAPHIRQRLYWVADDIVFERSDRSRSPCDGSKARRWVEGPGEVARFCDAGVMGQSDSSGRSSRIERAAPVGHGDPIVAAGGICQLVDSTIERRQQIGADAIRSVAGSGTEGRSARLAVRSSVSELGDAERARLERLAGHGDDGNQSGRNDAGADRHAPASSGVGHNGGPPLAAGPTNGFWSNPDWLFCRDGKWRPVEAGTFPLAHGEQSRVGRLRAYGNQIVRPQAAAILKAWMDCRP